MNQQFAKEYENLEQWHWWFRGRQRILESVLRREIGEQRLTSIASLGCGPVEGLLWLRQFIEPLGKIIGVDTEASYGRRVAPQVEYVIGRIESVPVASRIFDAVLALDVLEHLDDDAAGLLEAARLVKDGGLLLVTVPALQSLWGSQDVVSHHRRRYTKRTLLDAFARAGLPQPRVAYFNTFLLPPVALVRWTRRAFGLAERARSDFNDSRPGLLNETLAAVFSAERHLVTRLSLPLGVSLFARLKITGN